MDFELPSWDDIVTYTFELARKIYPIKNKFDAIICIWRGGACPTRLLADHLNIHNILNINAQYYEGMQLTRESPIIFHAISVDLSAKNVLVCDDISDSGNSLKAVSNYLEEQHCASITTATLYIKPTTKFIPNYYIKTTTAWVVFPWEEIEVITQLFKIYTDQGKSVVQITKDLISQGFSQRSIEFFLSTKDIFDDKISYRFRQQ